MPMALPTKNEIAQSAKLKPIIEIAAGLGARGDISTMPGEPMHPASEEMDIDENGITRGLE